MQRKNVIVSLVSFLFSWYSSNQLYNEVLSNVIVTVDSNCPGILHHRPAIRSLDRDWNLSCLWETSQKAVLQSQRRLREKVTTGWLLGRSTVYIQGVSEKSGVTKWLLWWHDGFDLTWFIWWLKHIKLCTAVTIKITEDINTIKPGSLFPLWSSSAIFRTFILT